MSKRNVYKGHRYVPKIMGEWNQEETYEGLSIVTNKGTSYTSKKRVPVGIDILDEDYWVVTGNYNAQVENYRQEVREFDDRISSNELGIEKTTTQLTQIAIYFDDFGAVGDGVTNNSQLFHDFLALGGNLVIPKGLFMIEASKYKLVSNTNLIFEEGAIVKLLPHSTSTYYMLDFYNTENVTVVNPTLDGSKADNSNLTGEWGHGLNIVNTVNTIILSPKIKDTSGDGIYIGHEYWGASQKETDNVVIKNAVINNVHRNGISLCGGRNITIDSPYINEVLGIDPRAGIDIEPEGEGGVKPFLENVVINNAHIENCFHGILFYLSPIVDKNQSVNIVINNPIIEDCIYSTTFGYLDGVLDGHIVLNSPISRNIRLGAYVFDRYNSDTSPHVRINNPEIIGFNRVTNPDDRSSYCFSFLNQSTTPIEMDVGNVTIVNPYIETSATDYLRFLYTGISILYGEVTGRVKNVTIINPELKEGRVLTQIHNTPEIKLIDGLNSLHMSPRYFETSLSTTMVTTFDNKNATDWLYLKTSNSGTVKGHRVRINIVTPQRITLKTTSHVLGFTPSGSAKGIYSSEPGASIELEFNGEYWVVLNIHGEWLPEK